jgi:hypothetical protein
MFCAQRTLVLCRGSFGSQYQPLLFLETIAFTQMEEPAGRGEIDIHKAN